MTTKAKTFLSSVAATAIFILVMFLLNQIDITSPYDSPPEPPGHYELDVQQAWDDYQAVSASPRCDRPGRTPLGADCQVPAYNREAQFGTPWFDLDGNGCNTRDDVLQAELTDVELRNNGCHVQSGTLHDPYTASTIDFTRGAGTSMDVQIDHIFPLSLAWDLGAHAWPQETRVRFANDPLNLLAVDGSANQQKSDRTMSEWMPPNTGYHCSYVARMLAIAREYNLPLETSDYEMVPGVLETCG